MEIRIDKYLFGSEVLRAIDKEISIIEFLLVISDDEVTKGFVDSSLDILSLHEKFLSFYCSFFNQNDKLSEYYSLVSSNLQDVKDHLLFLERKFSS